MARFDRKVERSKKRYTFKEKEVHEDTLSDIFKQNFNFRWIRFNIPSIIGYLLAFVVSTLVLIPMMIPYLGSVGAFVFGHGIFTGLWIVVAEMLINKEKINAKIFMIRYLFIGLLLAASSYLSIVVTNMLA